MNYLLLNHLHLKNHARWRRQRRILWFWISIKITSTKVQVDYNFVVYLLISIESATFTPKKEQRRRPTQRSSKFKVVPKSRNDKAKGRKSEFMNRSMDARIDTSDPRRTSMRQSMQPFFSPEPIIHNNISGYNGMKIQMIPMNSVMSPMPNSNMGSSAPVKYPLIAIPIRMNNPHCHKGMMNGKD